MKRILLLIMVFVALNAVAQDMSALKTKVKEQTESTIYTPGGKSSLISSFSDIRLKSDFGDESASATVGFSLKQSSLSFYFEQPFKEKPKKVTFFNQDGLQSGTSFKVAFQHTFWNPTADFNTFDRLRNEQARRNQITDTQQIRTLTSGDFDPDLYTAFLRSVDFKTPVLFGISFAGAKNAIDYLPDSSATKPSSETNLNYSVAASLGFVLAKSDIIAFSYTREVKYQGADETSVFNFPVPGSSTTYLKEVGVGPINKTDENKFQAEYRRLFFRKSGNVSLALNPKIFYLTSKKSFNIELPVYFLTFSEEEKIKGLQGGFSIGYSTKLRGENSFKNNFGVSIFVSAPFDLFNLFTTK